MNNKGFTMIELLASMVLLSILMLTAVPTVLGVMDDRRKTTILNGFLGDDLLPCSINESTKRGIIIG